MSDVERRQRVVAGPGTIDRAARAAPDRPRAGRPAQTATDVAPLSRSTRAAWLSSRGEVDALVVGRDAADERAADPVVTPRPFAVRRSSRRRTLSRSRRRRGRRRRAAPSATPSSTVQRSAPVFEISATSRPSTSGSVEDDRRRSPGGSIGPSGLAPQHRAVGGADRGQLAGAGRDHPAAVGQQRGSDRSAGRPSPGAPRRRPPSACSRLAGGHEDAPVVGGERLSPRPARPASAPRRRAGRCATMPGRGETGGDGAGDGTTMASPAAIGGARRRRSRFGHSAPLDGVGDDTAAPGPGCGTAAPPTRTRRARRTKR